MIKSAFPELPAGTLVFRCLSIRHPAVYKTTGHCWTMKMNILFCGLIGDKK